MVALRWHIQPFPPESASDVAWPAPPWHFAATRDPRRIDLLTADCVAAVRRAVDRTALHPTRQAGPERGHRTLRSGLRLPQHPDDLSFGKPLRLHGPLLVKQTLLPSGTKLACQVGTTWTENTWTYT